MKFTSCWAALLCAVLMSSPASGLGLAVYSAPETMFAGYPVQSSQHALLELEPGLFARENLDRETGCLATALYFEARSESREGQIAVAQVILNRKQANAYPDTICEVVWDNAHLRNRCQFSFTCDGKIDRIKESDAWLETKLLALALTCERKCNSMKNTGRPVDKLDTATQRATHYHADYVSPSWGPRLQRTNKIGRHIFYISPRVEKTMRGDA